MASIHKARYDIICAESKLRKESLEGIQSSDERARSVWTNALSVMEYIGQAKQQTEASSVAAYNKAILSRKQSIKDNMTKLGADEAFVATFLGFVDKQDTDNAMLQLMRLLIKRNPGLYRRQLAVCEAKVLQK